jgi:hypothetical protein
VCGLCQTCAGEVERVLTLTKLRLSFLNLAGTPDGGRLSSRDKIEIPDSAAAEGDRARDSGAFRGLDPSDATRDGRMNLSATDDGLCGTAIFVGRLPRETVRESRCWFLASVGVNSGPVSRERKREERRDSSSSSWKFGVVRYVTERVSVPVGWGIEGNMWVSFGSGDTFWAGAVSKERTMVIRVGSESRDHTY